MTALTLIGTYRVSVSDEEFRFIAEQVTGSTEKAQEEIAGLALVEVEVRGAEKDFDVGLLHQEGSEQVAWDEKYFSIDGLHLIGPEKPDLEDFRICFFLHYFDPSKKITSSYGDMTPTRLTDVPERLAGVCVYEHPG